MKKEKGKKTKKRNPKAQDVPLRYYQAHGKRLTKLEIHNKNLWREIRRVRKELICSSKSHSFYIMAMRAAIEKLEREARGG